MRTFLGCSARTFVFLVLSARLAHGDVISVGSDGINSAGLGLSGAGISIGQVEPFRPGVPDFDDMMYSNATVTPAAVFVQNGDPTANHNTDDHEESVAGVMISIDPAALGVSTGASLYASATNSKIQADVAITAQHIAKQNGDDVRAINMSFGLPSGGASLDGHSLLTQFVDWSAKQHNTLYVVAGNEGTGGIPIPTDNFNGMTAAFSTRVGGVYRQVDTRNLFTEDAEGARTSIDILTPGDGILTTSLNNMTEFRDGTSFAAPHVTGTVALLQQYGDARITASDANWDGLFEGKPTAHRHEVMKAVLMNSADKLKDDGTLIAEGKLLGMEKTILDTNGNTWLASEAFYDELIPLDDQMGTGQLNAKRALQQFLPGEHDSDTGLNSVPTIGWDYGHTSFNGDFNRYLIDTPLTEGDLISITLAWDREVTFDIDGGTTSAYDIGDTFKDYTDPNMADDVINDLDLFLVPLNSFTPELESGSFVGTTEHIFAQVPYDGEYEIWVQQQDNDIAGGQDYGLAWWYGLAPEIEVRTAGDFDGNGMVDLADLTQWQGDYGINGDSDADGDGDSDGADFLAWQRSFGMGAALAANAAAVPEPATWLLLAMGGSVFPKRKRLAHAVG